MKFVTAFLFVFLSLLSLKALAIEEHQIVVCNSYCSDTDKENMAIVNRYARISEITVIDDNNWTAKTFRVVDSSEPGQTLIDVRTITVPSEISTALNELKILENSLQVLSVQSRTDAGIDSISPLASPMKTGAIAKREYSVTVPPHIAPSVTNMWDAGYYGDTQWYIRGQTIGPAVWSEVLSFIFNKTKRFTVIATFADGSSITFEYDGSMASNSYKKIDSTAQKDGKGYKPTGPSKYYDAPNDIDIVQKGGDTDFVYTSVKTCNNYVISSSEGSRWSGVICVYVYTK